MLLQIVERQMAPDITVVELTGRLALGRESQRIETLVEDLAKKGSKRVIFDLTGVDYIDSTGISMVALASGKFKESGGALALVAPAGRVLQLLNLTQMSAIVKVCPTLDAAAAAL
jgi:anti-sigma B factor antagonist